MNILQKLLNVDVFASCIIALRPHPSSIIVDRSENGALLTGL